MPCISIQMYVLQYKCMYYNTNVVWHHALPSYLSQELERIQRLALKIIFPAFSYSGALQFSNFITVDERHSELCVKTLEKISRGGSLVKHLPMTSQHMHHDQTRGANKYILPKCRSERLCRSFFPSTCLAFNNQ